MLYIDRSVLYARQADVRIQARLDLWRCLERTWATLLTGARDAGETYLTQSIELELIRCELECAQLEALLRRLRDEVKTRLAFDQAIR
jgi:hypothetical protein